MLETGRVLKSYIEGFSPAALIAEKKSRRESAIPIPPAKLIYLVIGHRRAKTFLESGKDSVAIMTSQLKKNNIDIRNFSSILDFGCGCGRMIRHLPEKTSAKLYGSDYNEELIGWNKRNLHFAEFSKNNLMPPANYSGAGFDFIYARSVFTHLDDNLQKAWMAEFRRILNTNGYLYFSTHGKMFFDQLSVEEEKIVNNGGIVVFQKKAEGHNICTSFELPNYVRQNLLSGFSLIDYIPGTRDSGMQDVYLLQKLS